METLTKATAHTMSHFVNNLSPEYHDFCDIFSKEHPTLQQAFTCLCLKWIENMAEREERYIDARNEASYKVCKKVKNALSSYEGDKYWSALPTI